MPRYRDNPRERDGTNLGSDYTADETEFLLAMGHWKHEHGGRMPDCREVLGVALELGYRKPQPEAIGNGEETCNGRDSPDGRGRA